MNSMNHNSAGRLGGVILVGHLNRRRHIRWRVACLLACTLGIFGAAVAVGVYFALSGLLSPIAGMIGFFGPFITVGTGVRQALRLPVEKLAPIEG